MHNHSKLDNFGKDRANSYDQNNRHLVPIIENLHYLIQIVLADLPAKSNILCVGAGTGTEIIKLAQAFPGFTFVAVEPSESMLDVCRNRLQELNLLDRCELIHGHVQDISKLEKFDASLCLLVLHHTSKDGKERDEVIYEIYDRLKPSGYIITAEVSYDFTKKRPNDLMEKWKSLIRKGGTSEDKIQNLPSLMKEHLSVQSSTEIEKIFVRFGFADPIQFFQSFLIRAWFAQKNSI